MHIVIVLTFRPENSFLKKYYFRIKKVIMRKELHVEKKEKNKKQWK